MSPHRLTPTFLSTSLLQLVACLSFGSVFLFNLHGFAQTPSDSYFTRCTIEHASVKTTGEWVFSDLYPEGFFAPSCVMSTQDGQTHYMCSCEPEGSVTSGVSDSSEVFPEGSELTLEYQLRGHCREQLQKACGPFAPQIYGWLDMGLGRKCEYSARDSLGLGETVYNHLELECHCPDTLESSDQFSDISILAHRGRELSEEKIRELATAQLAQCELDPPAQPVPEFDEVFADQEIGYGHIMCSGEDPQHFCSGHQQDGDYSGLCLCGGNFFPHSEILPGAISPTSLYDACQAGYAKCLEAKKGDGPLPGIPGFPGCSLSQSPGRLAGLWMLCLLVGLRARSSKY